MDSMAGHLKRRCCLGPGLLMRDLLLLSGSARPGLNWQCLLRSFLLMGRLQACVGFLLMLVGEGPLGYLHGSAHNASSTVQCPGVGHWDAGKVTFCRRPVQRKARRGAATVIGRSAQKESTGETKMRKNANVSKKSNPECEPFAPNETRCWCATDKSSNSQSQNG